jgi:hypothetical protein
MVMARLMSCLRIVVYTLLHSRAGIKIACCEPSATDRPYCRVVAGKAEKLRAYLEKGTKGTK